MITSHRPHASPSTGPPAPREGTGIPDVPDVPDVAAQWYRQIAEAGAAAPPWLRWSVDLGAELAPALFAAVLLALWWSARRGNAVVMARALAAPLLTALAYLISELVKLWWQVDRPCRTLPDVVTIAACPEVGDWSFPSNHATIAAAAVVGITLLRPAWAWVAVPVAVLAASARVLVGVHYPTDVVAGLLLGATVAAALPAVGRALAPAVARLRPRSTLLLGAGPRADSPTVRLPRPERLPRRPS